MSKKRNSYSAQFKLKVAIEAAKELKTQKEIADEFGIHTIQVSQWKAALLKDGEQIFTRKNSKAKKEQAQTENELYEQIGRLKMELEWLKKKYGEHNS